ncbi:MAG: hypothetical protein ABSB90_05685 [Thermoplasmata archaeon]|jgi:hypothetical protein
MGERRVSGILSQKTLGEDPPPGAPVVPPQDPVHSTAPEPTPRPVVYPTVAASNTALNERQMRWLRERDRRAAAMSDTVPQTRAESSPKETG